MASQSVVAGRGPLNVTLPGRVIRSAKSLVLAQLANMRLHFCASPTDLNSSPADFFVYWMLNQG